MKPERNNTDVNKVMIYGATGYTGRMAALRASDIGLDPVLAGRDGELLRALASDLGVLHRVSSLDDEDQVQLVLKGVDILLNCAGPFARTARPLMAACLKTGTHYLDIAAELDSYQLAGKMNDEAMEAGVMLMPGCGGSVAMLGSLAAHAVERVSYPVSLRIALHVSGAMSRGSAISASQNLTAQCLMRKADALTPRDPGELRDFNFGNNQASCFPVTLPDLITIAHQTGIPDIETYIHVSGDAFPEGDLAALSDGPNLQEREANRYQAAVEVLDRYGTTTRAFLDTVNGYTFTPLAAIEAARRVLDGEFQPGFQTPVGLFGSGFAETIADTRIVDLPRASFDTGVSKMA
jgi:short subunit dehydrogenase-like uncharacterized protein